MFKTFAQAQQLLAHQQHQAQPVACPLLQQAVAALAPVRTATVTEATPLEAALLVRVLAVLEAHHPAVLAGLRAVPLPLRLWFEEDCLALGYDTSTHPTSRTFVWAALALPPQLDYSDGAELATNQPLINAWAPAFRMPYGAHAMLSTRAGAHGLASTLAEALTAYSPGAIEYRAQQLATTHAKNLPGRVYLAAHAPAMPAGWVPRFGMLEPSQPKLPEGHYGFPSLSETQAKEYRAALDSWAQAVTDFRMMCHTAWPLAWADSLLLAHSAQQ